jgi:hypothetical protein
MDTHFVDAKRKVERSIVHINGIEKWLWTINRENFEIACAHKKDAPERNLETVAIKRSKGFSLPLGPMIGDAIHNLRSALDAVAWMIVKAAGGTEEQLEKLYFPLLPDAALPKSPDYKTICAAIPKIGPIIADFVSGYKAAPECDLWALNQLDRIDKHRFVTPTITQSSGHMVAIRKEDEDNPPPIAPGAIYGIPRELIEGAWSTEENLRPGSKAFDHNQQSGYTVVNVRFREVLDGEEVIPKLWKFTELVSKLIDDLDEEIFRLEASQP